VEINVGSFNLRTLSVLQNLRKRSQPSMKTKRPIDKLPFLVDEVKRKHLDFICLQEVRKEGSGILDVDGYNLYYNGHTILRRRAKEF
jgi:hypothetical protein